MCRHCINHLTQSGGKSPAPKYLIGRGLNEVEQILFGRMYVLGCVAKFVSSYMMEQLTQGCNGWQYCGQECFELRETRVEMSSSGSQVWDQSPMGRRLGVEQEHCADSSATDRAEDRRRKGELRSRDRGRKREAAGASAG